MGRDRSCWAAVAIARREVHPSAVLLSILLLAGCASAPTSTTGRDEPTGDVFDSVRFQGRERPLIVATTGHDPNVPHDLVVAFHGRTNSNAQVRQYFDLEAHARRPTVFVYPSALPVGSPPRAWADPGDAASDLRDYTLFDAIVATVDERFRLDRNRVFAVGHSLGASFANSLACARGGSLKGTATVAGGISAAGCRGEVTALLIHHPDDRLVPVSEGLRARDILLDEGGLEATASAPAVVASFDCRRWGASSGAAVIWCLHDDARTRSGRFYPHGWPDDAGKAIMDFFDSLG